MGHTACGAVKAAMTTPPPAKLDPACVNLEHILAAIRPSLPRFPTGDDPWTSAVYSSVEQNIKDVVRLSPMLTEFSGQGKISMVGAVYALNTGKVHFSRPVGVTVSEHKPVPVTHAAAAPHATTPAHAPAAAPAPAAKEHH